MVFRQRYKTKKSRNTKEFFSLKVIISSTFNNSILKGIKNICGNNFIRNKTSLSNRAFVCFWVPSYIYCATNAEPNFSIIEKKLQWHFFLYCYNNDSLCNLQFARIKNPEITTSFDWFFFSYKLFIYAIITVWKIAISDRIIFCHNKREGSAHWYGATNSTLRRRLLHKRVS